jgi:hypothetical protein
MELLKILPFKTKIKNPRKHLKKIKKFENNNKKIEYKNF